MSTPVLRERAEAIARALEPLYRVEETRQALAWWIARASPAERRELARAIYEPEDAPAGRSRPGRRVSVATGAR